MSDHQGAYFVSLVHRDTDWTELAIALDFPTWESVRDDIKRLSPESRLKIETTRHERERRCASPSKRAFSIPGIPWERILQLGAYISGLDRCGTIGSLKLALCDVCDRDTHPIKLDPFTRRIGTVINEAKKTGTRWIDLSSLVGLGSGFTPSGDDILSGILLAQSLVLLPTGKRNDAGHSRPSLDTGAILARVDRTTPGGASLLRVALAGYPPRYQQDIVQALSTGDYQRVCTIAESHGVTSGYDFIAGLFIYAFHLIRDPFDTLKEWV